MQLDNAGNLQLALSFPKVFVMNLTVCYLLSESVAVMLYTCTVELPNNELIVG